MSQAVGVVTVSGGTEINMVSISSGMIYLNFLSNFHFSGGGGVLPQHLTHVIRIQVISNLELFTAVLTAETFWPNRPRIT